MRPPPYEPPEASKSKNIIAYKIVTAIILALLAYCLWRLYTRLPPAHPLQFPADYIPTRSVVPTLKILG